VRRGWADGLCLAVVLTVTAAVYLPVLKAQFTDWDDDVHLTQSGLFDPPSPAYLGEVWRRPILGLYIPLTYSVWMLLGWLTIPHGANDQVGYLSPSVYHAANLVTHLLAVTAVWLLVRRLVFGVDSARRSTSGAVLAAATIGAMIFAVHPIQVESVAWVSSFRDTLSGCFVAIAVWQYIGFAQTVDLPTPAAPSRWGTTGSSLLNAGPVVPVSGIHYAAVIVAAAGAMLAKPNAVALPLMLMALDVCWLRRSLKAAVAAAVPLLMLAVPCVIVTRLVQPSLDVPAPSWFLRPLVALDALAFYLWKLFIPIRLITDYSRTPQRVLDGIAWKTSLIPVAVTVILCVWIWRSRGPLAWRVVGGLLLATMALTPVLGLTPFDYQTRSTVADRYMYLPMIGIAAAMAAIAYAAVNRGGMVRVATLFFFAGLIAAMLPLTRRQVDVWHDSQSLWTHQLAINPDSWPGQNNMACVEIGAKNYPDAEKHARKGIELFPQNLAAHLNLGYSLVLQSRLPDAIEVYRSAAQKFPDESEAHAAYAETLYKSKDVRGAAAEFALAVNAKKGTPNDKAQRRYDEVRAELGRTGATQPATTRATSGPASGNVMADHP
jgi:protein O-mannosyl-transferase